MSFPSSPVDQQTIVLNGIKYAYSSANGTWTRTATNVSNGITTSTAPPTNPNVGDLWYQQTTGAVFRWTYDGTSYWWIDTTGGSDAYVGTANIVTVTSNIASTSSSTGSFVVAGGVGISGNLNVGANITAGNVNGNFVGTVTSSNIVATALSAQYITGNLTVTSNISLGNLSLTSLQGTVNTYSIGYLDLPQNPQSGDYTLTLNDRGRHIYETVSTLANIYIPTNTSVNFPVGTTVSIILNGAGTANLIANSGVTLYIAGSPSTGINYRTISAYGMGSLVKVATDTWYVAGVGVS